MNIKVFLFAMIVLGLSACRHYTCPTYLKHDLKESKNEVEKV